MVVQVSKDACVGERDSSHTKIPAGEALCEHQVPTPAASACGKLPLHSQLCLPQPRLNRDITDSQEIKTTQKHRKQLSRTGLGMMGEGISLEGGPTQQDELSGDNTGHRKLIPAGEQVEAPSHGAEEPSEKGILPPIDSSKFLPQTH